VQSRVTAPRGRRLEQQLYAPAGWTVERLAGSRWRVTAPADLAVGVDAPLRLLVTERGRVVAGDVATATAPFDPDAFGAVAWDDDFSTDRLASYRTGGQLGEPAAALSVSDGALRATATARTRSYVAPPVAVGDGVAVVVEPRAFAENGADQDSLFAGAVGSDPDDVALSWYSHTAKQSGVDVVLDGQSRPDGAGGGSVAASWAPGDRFATVLDGGTLSSWLEHDGAWTRLRVAPVGTAVDPAQLATWTASVSLRLDPGQIALDRLTVLSR
jgi:hypothetical protein